MLDIYYLSNICIV